MEKYLFDSLRDAIDTINYIFELAGKYCKTTIFGNQFCVGITEFTATIIMFLMDEEMIIRNINWKYDKDWEVVYPVFPWPMAMETVIENDEAFEKRVMGDLRLTKCPLNKLTTGKDFFFGEAFNSCEKENELNAFGFAYGIIVIFDFLRRSGKVLSVEGYKKDKLKKILKNTLYYCNIKILAHGIYWNQVEDLKEKELIEENTYAQLSVVKKEIEKMKTLDSKNYFDFSRSFVKLRWTPLFESYEVLCDQFYDKVYHLNEKISKDIVDKDRLFREGIYEIISK